MFLNNESLFILTEIDGASLRTLVNFAYSGSIDFSTYSPQTLWPLLSACSLLEMRDALQLCHKYMEDSISGAQPTVTSSQVNTCLGEKPGGLRKNYRERWNGLLQALFWSAYRRISAYFTQIFDPPEISTNQWSKWTNMYGGRGFRLAKTKQN